jgi:cobalt-zinc-cadmium efflux system outer membrane protein
MSRPRLLLLSGLLLVGGCLWPVQEKTDRTVLELASRPYDRAPALPAEATRVMPPADEKAAPAERAKPVAVSVPTDVQTTALMEAAQAPEKPPLALPEYKLTIPPDLPGAETPLLPRLDKLTPEQRERTVRELYPELPPLPAEPTPLPGPHGRPYTLADLQKLAAENSPTLRQAAADVQAAEGALVQARTWTNPTLSYMAQPTNNNSNAGAQGIGVDQPIRTFGKQKMQVAAAQKDLDNAVLALKRARSDLATNVRNAYYGVLVAVETVRVTRALARFTDEIYRWNTGYLASRIAAPYEPAALRSQSYLTRLAYQQAIYGHVAAWKTLVATLGLHQLPLTEVAGRIDRLIPYYDYDAVLTHALRNHTDVLTAANGVEKARYNLKLAQITPYPDLDVNIGFWKESTIPPFTLFYAVTVGFPLPIWDQNRGNIISAQAALARAVEESHRVEMALTNTLATNYMNYQNNLKALEYYRRNILPDQVRYYRGVFERRQADINASPSDLVTAQQALATNVQAYLGILGSLWTSVVSVADLLQTDDLFQLSTPKELPVLPDLEHMPRWLCPHGRVADLPMAGGPGAPCPPHAAHPPVVPAPWWMPPAEGPVLPPPRRVDTPAPPQAGKMPALLPPPQGLFPAVLDRPRLAGPTPESQTQPGAVVPDVTAPGEKARRPDE